MPSSTVLDIVQDCLNDMSSDNVNTVDETMESRRVTAIVKSTYYKLIAERRDWPHLGQMSQLTALSDIAKPTHMQIPSNINRIKWIKYDKRVLFADAFLLTDIEFMYPDQFMSMVNGRLSTDVNTQSVVDFGGTTLLIRDNVHPTYWTSFDDKYIIFDSFYSTLDSSLQQSKTQAFTFYEPTWGPTIISHTVNTAFTIDDMVAKLDIVSGNIYYYKCIIAGTTAGTAPAYSTVLGATQVDGTAQFLVMGTTAIDAFTPDLPVHLFPRFISECKSQCFNKIKQVVDSQEERDAKRQRIGSQFLTSREDGDVRKFNYGRK